MANREEVRKKIEARRAAKQAASRAKFAKMRRVAEASPGEIEKDLTQLADACAAQAEAYENLRENLDLVQAPKGASLAARTKAARTYARAFMRIAQEAPEQLADAVSEAYHSLDEQAGALENLAEHLGIDLNETPAEEAFAEEGVQELDRADEAVAHVEQNGRPGAFDDNVKVAFEADGVTTELLLKASEITVQLKK